jgi:hypothetical protein
LVKDLIHLFLQNVLPNSLNNPIPPLIPPIPSPPLSSHPHPNPSPTTPTPPPNSLHPLPQSLNNRPNPALKLRVPCQHSLDLVELTVLQGAFRLVQECLEGALGGVELDELVHYNYNILSFLYCHDRAEQVVHESL